MEKDIGTWPKEYLTCLVQNTKPTERPPLRQIDPTGPYDICNADLMDMGPSASGNRYALVIVDHFTKWGAAYPLANRDGTTVCRACLERFILAEGRHTNTLKTDQGLEFCNEKMEQVCVEMGIKHEPTKGHMHRENGAAERFIETLRLMLRKRGADLVDWATHLPYTLFRYNRTPHRATGYSPYMMLHGYEPHFPVSDNYLDQRPRYIDNDDYLSNLFTNLTIMRKDARDTMETYRHSVKEYYDTNLKTHPNAFPMRRQCRGIYAPRAQQYRQASPDMVRTIRDHGNIGQHGHGATSTQWRTTTSTAT